MVLLYKMHDMVIECGKVKDICRYVSMKMNVNG